MAKDGDSFEPLHCARTLRAGPLDAVDLPIVVISRDCKISAHQPRGYDGAWFDGLGCR